MQDSCVALLFASGKGILVGAKSIEELNTSLFEVKAKIQSSNTEKEYINQKTQSKK